MDDVRSRYNRSAMRQCLEEVARRVDGYTLSACCSLRGDVAGQIGQPLDPLLDVLQHLEAGLDRRVGNVLQNIRCDCVAQAIEVVDKLASARGEKQPVGAPVPGVVAPLEQAVLDQTVEQPHQRDRLQFKHVSQIDLGQSFL